MYLCFLCCWEQDVTYWFSQTFVELSWLVWNALNINDVIENWLGAHWGHCKINLFEVSFLTFEFNLLVIWLGVNVIARRTFVLSFAVRALQSSVTYTEITKSDSKRIRKSLSKSKFDLPGMNLNFKR